MREKITRLLDWLKVFVLLFAMTMGFYLIYTFAWYIVGLPLTNWALWLLLAMAGLTEYGYCRWIRERKTTREKLIELVGQVQDCGCDVTDVVEMNYVENEVLVDHLIANDVTVQEVDGCFRCKDSQQMTVTISNKLVDGVNTGWLGGNLSARFCPFCGRRLHQPPKGE